MRSMIWLAGGLVLASCSPAPEQSAAERSAPVTLEDRFAILALDCVHREFPNKISHVMDSFLFTLLLVIAVGLGARDQLIVARFSQQVGRTPELLVLAGFTAAVSAAAMAYFGSTLAAILPERAQDMPGAGASSITF